MPETPLGSSVLQDAAAREQPPGASGTRLKVAARPATVGATWMDLFQPGTASPPSLEARLRVIADITGALIQIHDNPGLPRPHRRHGRLTPRHLLIGVDGSASLFVAREPFAKLLPPQPDLGYLAPELLTQSGPSTQQSDIFSLGVLLWEALDNGRLFPHRRAAAISRLIARRSLPTPRIDEEWALPLGDVAMKALAQDPAERFLDATSFWRALREHLPAPDAARAQLSRLAQQALALELTAELRDSPPYLSRLGGGTSRAPAARSHDEASVAEAPARYSLHPEPSTRRSLASGPPSAAPPFDWSLSEPAPGRASQLDLGSVPPPAAQATSSNASPTGSALASTGGTASLRPPIPAGAATEPALSTFQVHLPRELIDASMPLHVSSQPPAPSFPWGALTLAALVFFGVGAAVAFGAVTALRPPLPEPPPALEAPGPPGDTAAPPLPPPQPDPASDVAGQGKPSEAAPPRGPAGAAEAPAPAAAEAAEPPAPEAAPAPKAAEPARPRRPRATKPRRARKSPPPAPAPSEAPAAEAPPPAPPELQADPWDAPAPPPAEPESLPFVEQPY